MTPLSRNSFIQYCLSFQYNTEKTQDWTDNHIFILLALEKMLNESSTWDYAVITWKMCRIYAS